MHAAIGCVLRKAFGDDTILGLLRDRAQIIQKYCFFNPYIAHAHRIAIRTYIFFGCAHEGIYGALTASDGTYFLSLIHI